jgi:hypothetical protein
MSYLRTFGLFWYDFIVGDDWRVALGAAAAIIVTFALAHHGTNWWWVLPLAVAVVLTASVSVAARGRRP